MTVLQDVQWVSEVSELSVALTALQQQGVSHAGSLTQLLQAVADPPVTFTLLGVDEGVLSARKNDFLDTLGDPLVRCRKVVWTHQFTPWVYAESWIPVSVAASQPTVMEGDAPLGKWLFNGQPIECSAFKFAVLSPAHSVVKRATSELGCELSSSLIARRRQYTTADQHSLIVVEVFFEPCLQHFARYAISEELQHASKGG